jgi:type I restriction enzyme S subunit
MSNIENLTIRDVCDFIGGSQPPKTNFSDTLNDGYIRFVQTRDFKTDNFITYIPKHLTTKFFTKKDIMIGRYGPPIFQIFRGMEGAYNVALLKAKPKKNILNDYLYYFLIQKNIFKYVDKLSPRTGGQTGVDLVSLYKYPINLPSISVQQKIAKVLSDLDAKIEINNRINTELEAMAKMLYDYWFVQFDFPDTNGKPYKSTGGKMVWNEELKREIPEGWEVETINEYADFKNGKGIKKEHLTDTGQFAVYGSNGIVGKTDQVLFSEPVIAIGRVGANYGEVHYSLDKCWISDNSITAQPVKKEYLWWLILILKNINYSNIAGGSAQPLITQGQLKALPIAVSNNCLIEDFHRIINSSYLKLNKNIKENQELASLRDWLLPMLMNGQVSVGDVEEELGMVSEESASYGK